MSSPIYKGFSLSWYGERSHSQHRGRPLYAQNTARFLLSSPLRDYRNIMKLLAVLSLFLAAVMASPVAPSAASAVPAAEVVPRNETLEAELAERQLVINYQQVYMVNCWNYGVQQSWLFVRRLST